MQDTWAGGRDSVTGVLFADRKKFPGQIPALASCVPQFIVVASARCFLQILFSSVCCPWACGTERPLWTPTGRYVHAKVPRLFFGIYTDVGHKTCAKVLGTASRALLPALLLRPCTVCCVKGASDYTWRMVCTSKNCTLGPRSPACRLQARGATRRSMR